MKPTHRKSMLICSNEISETPLPHIAQNKLFKDH